MSSRYMIEFAKEDRIVYISHLDLHRLFKRAFRRAGIDLDYSHGFNPHPRISFAQPLSLGYAGLREVLEFYTSKEEDPLFMADKLGTELPRGITLTRCVKVDDGVKSLSACVKAASYTAALPFLFERSHSLIADEIERFLSQEHITALKRNKKTKQYEPVDIRAMIKSMNVSRYGKSAAIDMVIDCGSVSNLNPESAVKAFLEMFHPEIKIYDVSFCRNYLIFDSCIPQTLGLNSEMSGGDGDEVRSAGKDD
ncbi:MAG: TIGR03936 family radical SAM-associated protein [Eubacterium sp.]|jgi:radical SAM-linked protein